jgi:hypothetical protein
MKIGPQTPIVSIDPVIPKSRPAVSGSVRSEDDRQEVSRAGQLLAKNHTPLQQQLSPREEVIQRFAGNLADPVKLHDRTIDRIIQRLKNT